LLRGHRDRVTFVTYSRDGKRLASTSADGTVRVWEAATGRCLRTLRFPTHRILFTGNGRLLLTGSRNDENWRNDDTLRFWDTGSGRVVRRLRSTHQHVDPLDLSPDGKILVTSGDRALTLWRTDHWKVLRRLRIPRPPDEADRSEGIQTARFSPDGKLLAVTTVSVAAEELSGPVCRVTLWETATGKLRRTLLDQHFTSSAYLAFSADGRRLAIGTESTAYGDVTLWHLPTGQKQVLVSEGEGNDGIAWVNRHQWLATGGSFQSVFLVDARTGRPVATLPHPSRVLTFAASPGGRMLATGNWDGVIRLWTIPAQAPPQAPR
jgi:WD40 repeat protein